MKNTDENDGWDTEEFDDLHDVLTDICDTKYEIDNCVKGCLTGCHTHGELADHLHWLAERLTFAADDISHYRGKHS